MPPQRAPFVQHFFTHKNCHLTVCSFNLITDYCPFFSQANTFFLPLHRPLHSWVTTLLFSSSCPGMPFIAVIWTPKLNLLHIFACLLQIFAHARYFFLSSADFLLRSHFFIIASHVIPACGNDDLRLAFFLFDYAFFPRLRNFCANCQASSRLWRHGLLCHLADFFYFSQLVSFLTCFKQCDV